MKSFEFNRKLIISNAWKQADYASSVHGGKKSEYFAYCLRREWVHAKSKISGTAKQIAYASDLQIKAIEDIVNMMNRAEKQGVTGYAKVAHCAIEAIDLYRGYAGILIDTLKYIPALNVKKTLTDITEALKNG